MLFRDPIIQGLAEETDPEKINLLMRALHTSPGKEFGPPKPETEKKPGGKEEEINAKAGRETTTLNKAAITPIEDLAAALGPVEGAIPERDVIGELGPVSARFGPAGPEPEGPSRMRAGLEKVRGFLTRPETRIILGEFGAALSPKGGPGEALGKVSADITRREVYSDVLQKMLGEEGGPVASLAEAISTTPGARMLGREAVSELAGLGMAERRLPLEEAKIGADIRESLSRSEYWTSQAGRLREGPTPDVKYMDFQTEAGTATFGVEYTPDAGFRMTYLKMAPAKEAKALSPDERKDIYNRLVSEFYPRALENLEIMKGKTDDPMGTALAVSLSKKMEQILPAMYGPISFADWGIVYAALSPEDQGAWNAAFRGMAGGAPGVPGAAGGDYGDVLRYTK